MDPRHEVYLVAEPVIEPAGTWSYTRRLSLPGASPPTLDVYFTRRTVPPTGGQSVYVYTNLGVRWINIGILPPRPSVTDASSAGPSTSSRSAWPSPTDGARVS